ncbi:hypothetical protein A5893_16160 [Pedobacter psychrophilus]|uniref:Glycoside hydrolase n=1 Tax=Pedobacter psychrophilus TaxID=1826909 RepID=A0A179DC95_9SPHI|nr:family 43 glycosylhydrolase [Pedobacter psychrophilus]OAQ38320.1 hypothetical protein A5893_16160 [Pedobacter psychrophilus]
MRIIVIMLIACFVILQSCKKGDKNGFQPQKPDTTGVNNGVGVSTFSNPIISANKDVSDPEIFKGGNLFYMIHPNNNTYKMYSSPDLITWTAKPVCFTKTNGSFWSAGSFKYSGTYNLYYTHVLGSDNRTIGVATSSSPEGPYTDANATLIVKKDANNNFIPVIDPSVFKDPVSDKVYLYYAKYVGTGTSPELRCVELNSDGLSTISGTDKKILSITQAWENINIEHPMVYYAPNADANHKYYMLYNGSGGALARYAIGYAYSSSPDGPFTKATEGTATGSNPLVQQNQTRGIYGPGAPNTVVDDAGKRWMIYRIKTTAGESWSDRAICVDEIFKNGNDQLICTPSKGIAQSKPYFK